MVTSCLEDSKEGRIVIEFLATGEHADKLRALLQGTLNTSDLIERMIDLTYEKDILQDG